MQIEWWYWIVARVWPSYYVSWPFPCSCLSGLVSVQFSSAYCS